MGGHVRPLATREGLEACGEHSPDPQPDVQATRTGLLARTPGVQDPASAVRGAARQVEGLRNGPTCSNWPAASPQPALHPHDSPSVVSF